MGKITARFDPYEKVVILSDTLKNREFNGKCSVVMNRTQQGLDRWIYQVHVYDDNAVVTLTENELSTLGSYDETLKAEQKFASTSSVETDDPYSAYTL